MEKIMRMIGVNILIDSIGWIELCDGSETGVRVLKLIKDPKNVVYTAAVNVYEVRYLAVKRFGREKAREIIATLNQYSPIVNISLSLALKAGDVRLQEGFSAVDSFVYAVAVATHSSIVTGDRRDFGKFKKRILI